jgi:hypothetical protein
VAGGGWAGDMTWRLKCMGDVAGCVARCDTWQVLVGQVSDWANDVDDDV